MVVVVVVLVMGARWRIGASTPPAGAPSPPPQVHLADGIHMIEFEHGTTSGSRLLRVDRQVRARLNKFYVGL